MLALIFSLLFHLNLSLAFQDLEIPHLQGPVMDEVGLLSSTQKKALEAVIRREKESGGAQVQIYVIRSLAGLSIEEASIRITDRWKLGTENKDDGVLFLIAPNERKLRIEVGQGLEGELTDLKSHRIIDQIVTPYFKKQEYYQGLYLGLTAILEVIHGGDAFAGMKEEPTSNPQKKKHPFAALMGLLFIFLFLMRITRGRAGAFLAGAALGHRRGGWGGGGGFGGGGWGGGGGGFGGGGSSGSW